MIRIVIEIDGDQVTVDKTTPQNIKHEHKGLIELDKLTPETREAIIKKFGEPGETKPEIIPITPERREALTKVFGYSGKHKLESKTNTINESKVKSCAKCGKIFTPAGNRQKYCSFACGLVPKTEKERLRSKITLANKEKTKEEIEAELDTTLAEIEARRKQAYTRTN